MTDRNLQQNDWHAFNLPLGEVEPELNLPQAEVEYEPLSAEGWGQKSTARKIISKYAKRNLAELAIP